MYRFALSAALVMSLLGGSAQAGLEGRLVLTLQDALAQYRKDSISPSVKSLDVYATCEGGRCTDVWGAAMDFDREIHFGQVSDVKVEGDRIRMTIEMQIGGDPWVLGGTGRWDLDLVRKGDRLEGTFTGEYRSKAVHAVQAKPVAGALLPPNPVASGHVPVQPGEHPRLLFRKSDLPRLKERAATPLGKAVVDRLSRSDDPIALGMMFQLTGDGTYARKAFPAVDAQMANRDQGAFAIGRAWGYKTQAVALAYDLCYDGWDDEQRQRVHAYFDDVVNLCLNRKHRVGTVNWDPGSNYTIAIFPGVGLATLALMGEKGLPPAEPLGPNLEAPRIEPPRDFSPDPSAPVVEMPIGKTAMRWLWIGPFHLHCFAGDDPLAGAGGVAKVRPKAGQTVKFRSQERTWQLLDRQQHPDYFLDSNQTGPFTFGAPRNQIIIATPRLAKREMSRLFLYTVVENKTAGWYRFRANFWQGQCYLNGQRLADGDVFHLGAGVFSWMVPVVLGAPEGHATPWFEPVTEDDAKKLYADPSRKTNYQAARSAWQEASKAYQADPTNATWLQWARTAEKWSILCLQMGMGDGGFQAEGESYTLEAHHVVHDYALAFRNVFGRSLTGRPDISHFAPRYVVTTAVWQDRNGQPRAMNQSFGRGEETIPFQYMARALGLVPQPPSSAEDWRPALLWFWQKRVGLSGEEPLSDAVAAGLLAGNAGEPVPLIQALVDYPLDVKPANPGTAMPRAWEARTRAFYAFRNEWKDQNDIIAQFYGRTGPGAGWKQPETGSFQIWAFGREMARKINDGAGKTGSRWFDNVVMLPEDPIDAWRRANGILHSALDPKTGGGSATVDMTDLYKCIRREGSGGEAREERFDGGINGLRAFAADYSGKSGAPGLFAVVDRIGGGGTKQWVFQLPEINRDAPDAWKLDTAGNAFTVAWKDGPSIKATFVSPAKVTIARSQGQVLKAHPLSAIADVAPDVVLVSGENPTDGEFFVILTVQKQGPGPEVKASGAGLAATATIGGVRVRFDGVKIIADR